MRLEWVNHASYIIQHEDFKLLVDPWIEGSAFNNGWDLISDTNQTCEELSNVNYIWISHEHPDHFSPSFFQSIPKEKRKNINILFQSTKDKRVVTFLNKIGYQTIELKLRKMNN
jgi:UDP-MurNAc hydroxylase